MFFLFVLWIFVPHTFAQTVTGSVANGGTVTSIGYFATPPKNMPACAFGLTRVEVWGKTKPVPSLDLFSEGSVQAAIYIRPTTRWACPYERAVALYGDDRVKYVAPRKEKPMKGNCVGGTLDNPIDTGAPCGAVEPLPIYVAHVEVCDDDGKSNCTVVYTEKKP